MNTVFNVTTYFEKNRFKKVNTNESRIEYMKIILLEVVFSSKKFHRPLLTFPLRPKMVFFIFSILTFGAHEREERRTNENTLKENKIKKIDNRVVRLNRFISS